MLNTSSWGQKRRCEKNLINYNCLWPSKAEPSVTTSLLGTQFPPLGCLGRHRGSTDTEEEASVRKASEYKPRQRTAGLRRRRYGSRSRADGWPHMRRGCCPLPRGCRSRPTPRASVMAQALRKRKFLTRKVIQHTINYIMCQKEETMTISDYQLFSLKKKVNSLMIKKLISFVLLLLKKGFNDKM